MLIMNFIIYQHLTNDRKDEEFENFDELSQLRTTTKRIGRRRMLIQNKCVRKRGGALLSAASAYFLPLPQYS